MNSQTTFTKAREILGQCGRLISSSKSGYLGMFPDNEVVFNANICTESGKIWFGDLDITRDKAKLRVLADALGERVYVLREMDARFNNESSPRLDKAVYVT